MHTYTYMMKLEENKKRFSGAMCICMFTHMHTYSDIHMGIGIHVYTLMHAYRALAIQHEDDDNHHMIKSSKIHAAIYGL